MVRNNQLNNNRGKLDELLRNKTSEDDDGAYSEVIRYARLIAEIENLLVVVSDMAQGKSHIVAGGFSRNLGLDDYHQDNSIWESRILSLMPDEEREEKYLAELRFFNYLKKLPKTRWKDFYLVSKLRFRFTDGEMHDVLHRMFYVFDKSNERVRYAICTYGPLTFDLSGKSCVVDSISGIAEILTDSVSCSILSYRERQVLALIDTGMKSREIAECLSISINTVSRHRQGIIGKLQVKNTHEACRIAKGLNLI